jgi:hypothetical protein
MNERFTVVLISARVEYQGFRQLQKNNYPDMMAFSGVAYGFSRILLNTLFLGKFLP